MAQAPWETMKTMMINNGDNEKAGLYFYNNINNINQQLFRGGTTHPHGKGQGKTNLTTEETMKTMVFNNINNKEKEKR